MGQDDGLTEAGKAAAAVIAKRRDDDALERLRRAGTYAVKEGDEVPSWLQDLADNGHAVMRPMGGKRVFAPARVDSLAGMEAVKPVGKGARRVMAAKDVE